MKKIVLLIFSLFMASTVAIIPASATTYQLNFTKSGGNYLYSNNVETILGSEVSSSPYGKYTVEHSLSANNEYTAEFYHHNNASTNLTFGIAIKNNNTKSAQVRVLGKAVNAGSQTLDTATLTTRDFGNSTNDQYITIPAGQTVVLLSKDVTAPFIVDGKVSFVPTASNMKARIFYMKTSNYNVNSIFGLPKQTTSDYQKVSGVFPTWKRYATVDGNIFYNNTFYLSSYSWVGNQNEYDTPISYIGKSNLDGNYGVLYDLQLKNAAGKRLKITPYLNEKDPRAAGQLVLWTSSTGWYRTTSINHTSAIKYWVMSIPADQHIKYMLPGGNYGNVKFDIID
ncbi:hypothetical protein FZC71_04220 [Bacillus subtilis]|nr:hypothetical protein FZC71_04220 [Bacillus subtilis]